MPSTNASTLTNMRPDRLFTFKGEPVMRAFTAPPYEGRFRQ